MTGNSFLQITYTIHQFTGCQMLPEGQKMSVVRKLFEQKQCKAIEIFSTSDINIFPASFASREDITSYAHSRKYIMISHQKIPLFTI